VSGASVVKVTVKIFSPIDDSTDMAKTLGPGHKMEILLEKGTTIEGLVNKLSDVYGKKVKEAIINLKTGAIKKNIIVLVNGQNIEHLKGLKTQSNERDTAVFAPVLGGG
jgi:molybdopterin converting factor small subunit